ncbi:hypothetical protein HAP48_0042505 [Bradyrhizobium septentrionale]|uniref:Uncharacterized protein n=1 Tax=Bradyrhizobium septentrionale TaxID=1404411 RepID=A0A973W2T0_9BRAD|nr:hypothetical protein [Bradyrhizobium septentrionale]UGY15131.1 hypothetical protein HAP48_0042505 [Bradyrhizobium septentrionale]UGY23736.1 hypothetical protein HU675_0038285 [Bradyrhizobium septentrionale]
MGNAVTINSTITTHRLIPPANGRKVTVNGRTFDPAGGVQDVPEFDSAGLQANGWMLLAPSGPTTARPTSALGTHPLLIGFRFYDTTINHLVIWDGKNWKNETGATA